MNKRSFPAAAGLVILYAGVFQLGMAAPMLVEGLTRSLDSQLLIASISLVLSLAGLTAFGYCVATERSLVPTALVWGAGTVGSVVTVMKLGEVSGSMMVMILLQQLGGPIALVLVNRSASDAPPMRRELGALMVIIAISHVIGSIWMLVYQLHMFGLSSLSLGSVIGMSVWPIVSFVVSAFAVRAAKALLAGDPTAATKVMVWKWVAIGSSVATALLSFVSFLWMDRELPVAILVNPFVGAAMSAIMPLAIGRLVDRVREEPVDPRDAASVPTVFAWAALWLVPLLLTAAFVLKSSFVGPLLGAAETHAKFIGTSCGLAAALLLVTAISVVRALPSAKILTQVTAALSVCAAAYVAYKTLQVDWHDMRPIATVLPVGSFITFAAAMVLLAMFEARREQHLAPARVVD